MENKEERHPRAEDQERSKGDNLQNDQDSPQTPAEQDQETKQPLQELPASEPLEEPPTVGEEEVEEEAAVPAEEPPTGESPLTEEHPEAEVPPAEKYPAEHPIGEEEEEIPGLPPATDTITAEELEQEAPEGTAIEEQDVDRDVPEQIAEEKTIPMVVEELPEEQETIEESLSEEVFPEKQAAEEKPADEQPAEEKPAEEQAAEEKPADEQPAEEKPAEEQPAEEKPAEEKSVEEQPAEEQPAEEKPGFTQMEDNDALMEKYNVMDRDQLVKALEELVGNGEVQHIRRHIGFIKAAYRKLLRDENLSDFEKKLGRDREEDAPGETMVDPLSTRFDAAFAVYKEKKAVFDQLQEKEKHENLVIKEKILEELRLLIESEEELKKTYDLFNALQERWRSVGPIPQSSKSTLWNNYHFLVEKFFDKVKINKELKDLDLKKNLESKTELCEKAEELLLESSITRSFQQLQNLHEAWKETGPVPKDKKDEIWQRFKAATDKLNNRRQEYYELVRDEQNNNYAAKLVLCEKAEELNTSVPETPRQWQQKTDKINELFKVWKSIGFAPKKVNNEVWNRFRSALDTFFSNKKEFFKKYKDQQRDNYNQKLNLCLQAEALQDSDDWKANTDALINLQKEWKQIGPVPAKFSDKIWKRFRQACDHFFKRKGEHFENIGSQQDGNLKQKLALIEQIKSHQYTSDNTENLNILKDYQRQWMNIGHVPIKQKDRVQAEFRKAIDHQFETLNISKKAKNTLSFRSKIENLKNVPHAGNIIYKEKNMLISRINALESDIKVLENNIGFFASSKKADILKAEFEEKIEKAHSEIDVLKEKLRILREA